MPGPCGPPGRRGVRKRDPASEPVAIAPAAGHSNLDLAIEARRGHVADALQRHWRKRSTQKTLPDEFRALRPQLHAGQFLSGLSVIDSPAKKRELARRYPMGLALDMEVHGFYSACAKSPLLNTQFLAIKGVADLGDGEKKSGRFDALQPSALQLSWLTLDRLIADMV